MERSEGKTNFDDILERLTPENRQRAIIAMLLDHFTPWEWLGKTKEESERDVD